MALNAYMKIVGQKQGAIKGGVGRKGRENSIEVLDFDYSVVSPRDSASGLPTGRRQHQPVKVTVPTGQQTPQIFTYATTNETLTSVEIDVYQPSQAGVESLAFTLKLANASVSEFDLALANDPGASTFTDVYSFTFQSITLTSPEGGTTASDNWEIP